MSFRASIRTGTWKGHRIDRRCHYFFLLFHWYTSGAQRYQDVRGCHRDAEDRSYRALKVSTNLADRRCDGVHFGHLTSVEASGFVFARLPKHLPLSGLVATKLGGHVLTLVRF